MLLFDVNFFVSIARTIRSNFLKAVATIKSTIITLKTTTITTTTFTATSKKSTIPTMVHDGDCFQKKTQIL